MHRQVELQRTFKFKHSGREWTGIPLIVANMDTVRSPHRPHRPRRPRCLRG